MKRTYVDIIGEYYDNLGDLTDQAHQMGLRVADLKKIFRMKRVEKRKKFFDI